MKTPTHVKDRKLQSGRIVSQLDKEIHMTISSMCPDKWLFVDLENGNVWHKREDRFDQKEVAESFWRGANPKEIKELRRLKI